MDKNEEQYKNIISNLVEPQLSERKVKLFDTMVEEGYSALGDYDYQTGKRVNSTPERKSELIDKFFDPNYQQSTIPHPMFEKGTDHDDPMNWK